MSEIPKKINGRLILGVILGIILAWLVLSGRLPLFGGGGNDPAVTVPASPTTEAEIPLVTGEPAPAATTAKPSETPIPIVTKAPTTAAPAPTTAKATEAPTTAAPTTAARLIISVAFQVILFPRLFSLRSFLLTLQRLRRC